MTGKKSGHKPIIPDLLKIEHEYLFKTIGRDRKYSLELKCVFLILIFLVPCLITNIVSGPFPGTLPTYIVEGWLHLIASVFTGVFAWFLIRFLKRIDGQFRLVDQIISPPEPLKRNLSPQRNVEEDKKRKAWKQWNQKINRYRKWARRLASPKWYYLDAIVGAICGLVLGIYVITPSHGWILYESNGWLLKDIYLRAWFIFYGFFLGGCLYYIFGAYGAIRKYCKDVVSDEELIPLDPDRTGGLRELGRLSLDLDLIVALPSIAIPMYLLRFKIFQFFGREVDGGIGTPQMQAAIVLCTFYALVLAVVFFASISPAHDPMVKAKTKYLLKIHNEYKDMHKKLLDKLDTKKRIEPTEYKRLSGLYDLYDRVERMAVWPLDFRTVIRFAITSTLPLLSIGITIYFSSI